MRTGSRIALTLAVIGGAVMLAVHVTSATRFGSELT